MNNTQREIWQIIKDVYNMKSDVPTTDFQIEVVDRLDKYVKGTYKPVITQTQVVDEVVITADAQPVRRRGRPRKLS